MKKGNDLTLRATVGKLCPIASILLSLLCYGSSLPQPEMPRTTWVAIMKAFNSYLDDPSRVHGKELVNWLPKKRVSINEADPTYKDYLSTIDLIFSDAGFGPFMLRVQQGDKYAIEAALRILNIADGGDAESILIILGDALRDHPLISLEVMHIYKGFLDPADIMDPAVMTRYEMGSEEESRELRKRLEALRKINDPKYAELKNALIREILKALGRSSEGPSGYGDASFRRIEIIPDLWSIEIVSLLARINQETVSN